MKNNNYIIKTKYNPIIIIGMHRSGTSMLAGLLKQLGLMIGYGRQHNESIFFHRLNKYIERVCNCGWDNPEPIRYLDNCPEMREIVLKHLYEKLTGPEVVLYFEPLKWKRFLPKSLWPKRSLEEIDEPWGWKDPRNTFTARLWKELFPDAKYLHIYRNGVDVAVSLQKREFDLLHSRPLDTPYPSPRCCSSLDNAFELWAIYVKEAFALTNRVGTSKILHIRYEDLLKDPIKILNEIIKFCNLNPSEELLTKVSKEIDKRKAYKFAERKEIWDFYLKVKEHPLMKKLGYDKVISE